MYQEHAWDLKRLASVHTHSHINVEAPEKSEGLTAAKAAELLEVSIISKTHIFTLLHLQTNGPNKLPEAREISDLRLFLLQFLNLLWGLLFAAATLSLIGYFLDPTPSAEK